jgi:integrase
LVERVRDLSEPVSPKAVRKATLNAGRRLGIHLNPHQLRTWYCNHLIDLGHPPHIVQKLMRHANVKVTFTHYARAQANDLERAVDGLGGL